MNDRRHYSPAGRDIGAVTWLADRVAVFQYLPDFIGSGIELAPIKPLLLLRDNRCYRGVPRQRRCATGAAAKRRSCDLSRAGDYRPLSRRQPV